MDEKPRRELPGRVVHKKEGCVHKARNLSLSVAAPHTQETLTEKQSTGAIYSRT